MSTTGGSSVRRWRPGPVAAIGGGRASWSLTWSATNARDLALVADILGHTDVKTTRRYARSELEDRRAALEQLDRG